MKRRYKIGIGIVAFLVLLYFLGTFQAYRGWVYICENTGSYKGHIEWFFGKQTSHRYEKSVLEGFIQENYPDIQIEHRWTSCAGTGCNIFGQPLLFGHGQPGAIMSIPPEMLEKWVQTSEPEEVIELYKLLASDENEDAKRQRIDEIIEEVFKHFGNQ
ncbi:MAG: hypothetical protein ACYS8S_07440 [Planctomycetota bacterium]|jgi:hypothetical protein